MVENDESVECKLDEAKTAIRKIIEENKAAHLMLRLPWIDDNNDYMSDEGLAQATELLQPIVDRFPDLTTPTIDQLAVTVAVELTGGPVVEFIPATPGRGRMMGDEDIEEMKELIANQEKEIARLKLEIERSKKEPDAAMLLLAVDVYEVVKKAYQDLDELLDKADVLKLV